MGQEEARYPGIPGITCACHSISLHLRRAREGPGGVAQAMCMHRTWGSTALHIFFFFLAHFVWQLGGISSRAGSMGSELKVSRWNVWLSLGTCARMAGATNRAWDHEEAGRRLSVSYHEHQTPFFKPHHLPDRSFPAPQAAA